MRELYGTALQVRPPNPDNGTTFTVDGVDVGGDLSSQQDSAEVTSLYSSACSGP